MKTVKVYGALKEYIGQGVFSFDVLTPAEAIQALCANFKGLDKYIYDSEKDGIVYDVKVGKQIIQEKNIDDLAAPWSDKDVFSIRPVIQGAGRGFGRFLIGAALLGLGAIGVGSQMFIGTLGGTPIAVSTVLKQFGAIMMLSGLSLIHISEPTRPY